MSKIKAEQFVRVWLEAVDNSDSLTWVASTLGISTQRVSTLADNLRKNGVALPSIRRPFVEPLKIDKLNQLIREKFGD
jgi:biotin operon repressor